MKPTLKKVFKSFMSGIKNNMNISKIFLLGIVLKVFLLSIFTSEYNESLFYPFVSSFIQDSLNPWQYYVDNELNLDAFPYHSVMLYILYPFSLLAQIVGTFSFKLPLLISDLSILVVLFKLFPQKKDNIYWFYFLNPIVIYSTYIHAQLDIIPTAMLLWCIYFLISKKYVVSMSIFALAVATKFHIIIALPLVLYYIYKVNIKWSLIYFFGVLVIFLLLDLPFIFSDGFTQMVLFNSKQSLLFDTFYDMTEAKIFLPVAGILAVYFHFFNQQKINYDLLFFYFGLLFTVTIFFIYPSPAWYVWIVPFLSIYFIQNQNKVVLIYIVFSIAYLVFFLFFYQSDYIDILFLGIPIDLKIQNEKLMNLSFTFLEVLLLVIIYLFYKYGIKSNSIYKRKTNLVLGIGGDSATGKTTLLDTLEKLFDNKLLKIEGDGEHKWERGDENWQQFTHLDPKANNIHKQADGIYALKNNKVFYRKEYDHKSGKFTKILKIEPKEFIVIAGLHPFYLPRLRKNVDLKIYIDTDEELRRHWKIIRDKKSRGYEKDSVLKQIIHRENDATKYIHPQKDFADIIIKYFPISEFELGVESPNLKLGLRITFDANIHFEDVLEKLDCELLWDYNEDLKSQYIELVVEPDIDFEEVAQSSVDNISEIVSPEVNYKSGYEGLIQLILLILVSNKLKEENNEI
ncbi:MAG: Unknown protein [uncultured Campylobacterales bacterium]|uniref:phosphoribulokinase n=1 Tax=uncultured Campylobacterales bacterium TaxID=352960 RepID=A0A6S6T099_9BACT|nr:MAG: Unknown protein [uncultured Campylobacterales bacterium]